MMGTEKTLGSVPNRLDEDILNVYKMLPTTDVERLLEHIAWMENELERVERLQRKTERELKKINSLLAKAR